MLQLCRLRGEVPAEGVQTGQVSCSSPSPPSLGCTIAGCSPIDLHLRYKRAKPKGSFSSHNGPGGSENDGRPRPGVDAAQNDDLGLSASTEDAEVNNGGSAVMEGSEMLYARMSEVESAATGHLDVQGGERTFYLGKPFNLAYIVHEAIDARPNGMVKPLVRLHWPVPKSVDDKAHNLGFDQRLEPEVIDFLRWRGALTLPEKRISDRLVLTYFEDFHPAFPIFDRAQFALLYTKDEVSMLVLQAIYFVSVTLCDESLLHEAGFANRFTARQVFYQRARSLYDTDYETERLNLVRALLLMSFCWNGPRDAKDAWYWLGASIGIAQSEGMHRSYV
jgi:hypothetical protein